jgi:hypothetical protein
MDYETFGEHQWEDTGIFEFLSHLPDEILKHPDNDFKTPSEVVASFDAVDSVDVPNTISWADIVNIKNKTDTIDWSNVLAIKTKTDTIDWTDIDSIISTAGEIKAKTDTILWTDVLAIKTKTDTILWTDITAIKTETNELGGMKTKIDLILDEVEHINPTILDELDLIKAKTDQLTFTVAGRVDATASGGGGGLTPEEHDNVMMIEGARDNILEIYALYGLDPTKPLIVTPTVRQAGTISQKVTTTAKETKVQRQ